MNKLVLTILTLFPFSIAGAAEYALPSVVVTAERQAISTKQEPQSVTVITKEDIERKGASNVSEALADVLGLDSSRGSQNSTSAMGGHQLMLRGMNTNQTLVLVDGHRLADEDTSQTQNVYILSRMDVSQVDRIEVLRGPAGAMYGSDAMGGVIQIFTKKPGKKEMDYGFQLGSRENTTHFRYDPGKWGRWSMDVHGRITKVRPISFRNIGHDSRGVMYDGYDTPAYGNQQQFGIDGLYDFQNQNENQLRVSLDYFHEKTTLGMADATMTLSQMTQGTGMPPQIAGLVPPIVVQKEATSQTERKEWSSALTYTGHTPRNEYEGRVYYSQMKKFSENWNHRPGADGIDLSAFKGTMFEGALPGMLQRMQQMLDEKMPTYAFDRARYTQWGVDGKDTLRIANHSLTFGGEWLQNTYEGTRLISQKTEPGKEAKHSRQETALYVSDWWQLSNKWHVAPSLRLAKGSEYDWVATPKLGFTYEWNDTTRIKANFGKGFRAPTISELYICMDTGHPVAVIGNSDLVPEKSTSYDVGLSWERGHTSYGVSYFHNRVKHLIDTRYMGDHYEYVNRREADIQGMEMTLFHGWSDRWTLETGYTYLDAQDSALHTRLDNRSRHTWTTSLTYDDHKEYGFTGKIWDSFHGQYHFDGADYTYHAVNLSLQKHWGKTYQMTLGLYNIGNKKIDDLYVNGREWYVGMEYKM